MMSHILLSFAIAAGVSFSWCNAAELSQAIERPNVVIILTDDLGYGDLGCYGAEDVRTPHLDRMASEGTRFTNFLMAAPLCTPSRAALMTGRYPGHFGLATGVLRPNATKGLGPQETTLAEVVKPRGYATGCIGKWHLGFLPGMLPRNQGFDSYYGVLHNLDKYETVHFEAEGGMPMLRNETVVQRPAVPAQITRLYTQEALAFIEAHRDEPFFLYLAHAMPHIPFDASPQFKGTSARGLYGDAVEELDWSTGQILNRLRSLGLAEKTLVLFTSDNGPERRTPGSAGPLRGTKHTVYEGGVRVPCIAWWPGRVPAGRISSEFLTALDVLPTVARLSGGPLPAKLDGCDFTSHLLGHGDGSSCKTYYTVYGGAEKRLQAVREVHWKLHLSSPPELYDLSTDLGETKNIAEQHPEIVQRLTELAKRLRESIHAVDSP